MKRVILLLIASICFFSSNAQTGAAEGNEKLGCTFSFPWVNEYRFVDYQKKTAGKKAGFFGLGIGVFYKKADSKLSLNFSYTEDLSSPAGLIDYSNEGTSTNISTAVIELSWHKPIKSGFGCIAGFNVTDYRYTFENNEPEYFRFFKVDKTIGLTAGIEYRFNKLLSVATLYRPALGSFETDDNYRHTISLDIRLDIHLKKLKKNYF
ncbi:MAG: hypothetical protein M3R27_01435 [Bacteroidota bacterium]|nr:hypothetical protein [Bacteroidota bacterium]